MRRHNNEYISMRDIKGDVRLCCSTTPEFRDRVNTAARRANVKAQDFVLDAVRAKMQAYTPKSPEDRLSLAFRGFIASKRTPAHIRQGIEKMLEPFLP